MSVKSDNRDFEAIILDVDAGHQSERFFRHGIKANIFNLRHQRRVINQVFDAN